MFYKGCERWQNFTGPERQREEKRVRETGRRRKERKETLKGHIEEETGSNMLRKQKLFSL